MRRLSRSLCCGGVSLTVLALLSIHSTDATAQTYSISTSGTGPLALTPSSDTLTLNGSSLSAVPGVFNLQSANFGVGNSGTLQGSFPLSISETVTINGDTQAVARFGTVFVTNPASLNEDTLSLELGPEVAFPKAGVLFTPNLAFSPPGGVGASFVIDLSATLTVPTGAKPAKRAVLFNY
jgi:hypothetical protein